MAIAEILIQFTEWAETAIGAYGYVGLFLVSVIGTASVIIPTPVFAFVFAAGAVLNPWLVGLIAGVGSGIGEISAYAVGRGGRKLARKKYAKTMKQIRQWSQKYSLFLVVVIFNATPLPADVIGIFAGLASYNVKRFLLASIIGKIILSAIVALAGFYSFEAVKLYVGIG